MEYHLEAAFQKYMGIGYKSQCFVSSLFSFKMDGNFCTIAYCLTCLSS